MLQITAKYGFDFTQVNIHWACRVFGYFILKQFNVKIFECYFLLRFIYFIQGSTRSPEPYEEIISKNYIFPYHLISLPTNDIYHNLTQVEYVLFRY